jgi:hypothetical protein
MFVGLSLRPAMVEPDRERLVSRLGGIVLHGEFASASNVLKPSSKIMSGLAYPKCRPDF